LWKVEDNFFPRPPAGFDDVYNVKAVDAVTIFQRLSDLPATGIFNQATLDDLAPYMDAYAKLMYLSYIPPRPKPQVPALGPVYSGGASVLLHSLTHETDGIPYYPAFDDGWRAGRAVLAPEDLTVTEQSGSAGGDAFYATGKSKLRYWFGHLAWAPPTGRTFAKGSSMGVIASIPSSQGGPHVHVGIDARALIGHELEHKTNYQTGAPSVGEQLARALA
jgi:hypothetical protein